MTSSGPANNSLVKAQGDGSKMLNGFARATERVTDRFSDAGSSPSPPARRVVGLAAMLNGIARIAAITRPWSSAAIGA
jgi:hypothetical protein